MSTTSKLQDRLLEDVVIIFERGDPEDRRTSHRARRVDLLNGQAPFDYVLQIWV